METIDDLLGVLALRVILQQIEELKKLKPGPLPWGLYQKYQSFVPQRTVEELRQDENTYWLGYAEAVAEFKQLMDAKGFVPFVDKKKGK
jgi:hypothetical protein